MTKTFVSYLEGDPANTTKRDDLVRNIPLMVKHRHYDSLILGNMYNDYDNDPLTFHKFFDPVLTIAKQYGVQVIPSVHDYLSPAWGQDIYTYQWMYPVWTAHEHTWNVYFERVKKLKQLMPDMRYFFMDFENQLWAQQNSPVITARLCMKIAECILDFCEKLKEINITPILYDIDARGSNTGTPNFTKIMSILVSCLTEANIIFGDTNCYANPWGQHPDWALTWPQILKMYPDEAQSKIMAMGIEIYNAPYGYSFDEWDKRIQGENIPWSALFGAVTPT